MKLYSRGLERVKCDGWGKKETSEDALTMRLPRVRFTVKKTIVTVLMIVAPGRAAEDSPKARLAAIEAAQKEASARYGKELQAAGPSAEAQKPAVDRYLAAVEKNAA